MGTELRAESAGGEIEGPEHQPGRVGVDALGGENAADLGFIESKVAGRFRDPHAGDTGKPAGASHVVEAGTGVQVMAATGTAANGGSLAAAAFGQDVGTGTDHEVRVHGDLRKGQSFRIGVSAMEKRGEKCGATLKRQSIPGMGNEEFTKEIRRRKAMMGRGKVGYEKAIYRQLTL